MTIKDFIKKYEELSSDKIKEDFLKNRIIEKYVPFTKKVAISTTIAKNTVNTVVAPETKYERTITSENTNARYLQISLYLIDLYTDLEIGISEGNRTTNINVVEIFESLDQYNLIEILIDYMPQSEMVKFEKILQACVNDELSNTNNLINYLDTKFESIRTVFEVLEDTIVSTLSSNLDIDKDQLDGLREVLKAQDNNIVNFPTEKDNNNTDTES